MRRLFILVFALIMLSACENTNSQGTEYSGEARFDKICIDGVGYYYRRSGYHGLLAPRFDRTGKIVLCD